LEINFNSAKRGFRSDDQMAAIQAFNKALEICSGDFKRLALCNSSDRLLQQNNSSRGHPSRILHAAHHLAVFRMAESENPLRVPQNCDDKNFILFHLMHTHSFNPQALLSLPMLRTD